MEANNNNHNSGQELLPNEHEQDIVLGIDIAAEQVDDFSIYTADEIAKEVDLISKNLISNKKSITIDGNLFSKLENEANRIATSVDGLTENLTSILHSVSALTMECLDSYGNAINKTCDAIDHDIKLMYQLMAKCEELNKLTEPLKELHRNVKQIRRILELLEGVA